MQAVILREMEERVTIGDRPDISEAYFAVHTKRNAKNTYAILPITPLDLDVDWVATLRRPLLRTTRK